MGRRLDSVKIQNFRPYHDFTLNFKPPDKTDMNVIIGGNRVGKTNIINSLLWALYGKEAILKDDNEDMPFIKNERYMSEPTSVTLDLTNSKENERINVKRSDKGNFSILKKTSKMVKYEPVDDPEIEVKKILPKSVRTFFLFRGEFLDGFIENANKGYLLNTIVKVSQLDTLKRIEETLDKLEDDYRSKIAKKDRANKKLQDIKEQIDLYDKSIRDLEERIKEDKLTLQTNRTRIDELSKLLNKLGKEHIQDLLLREKNLNSDKDQTNSEILLLNKEIIKLFLDELSEGLLFDSYKELKEKLDEMEKEGVIPPPISPPLIDKILNQKPQKCIVCGTEIEPTVAEKLRQIRQQLLKDKTKVDELYKLSLSLFFDKEKFDMKLDSFNNKIEYFTQKEEGLEGITKQLNHVSEELDSINKNKIELQKHNAERKILKDENEKLEATINQDVARKEKFLITRDGLNIEFKKEASKATGTGIYQDKLDIASEIKENVHQQYDIILDEIRRSLIDKTVNNFKNMFWENYQFMDYKININKDFGLEVFTPKGNNIALFLSTGETKVLALSFICALSDFYGFDFPIIIDAPFTELQPEVMLTVLETLKTLSSKQQVIILTIPKNKQLMEELKGCANKVFELKKEENDNTARIEIK